MDLSGSIFVFIDSGVAFLLISNYRELKKRAGPLFGRPHAIKLIVCYFRISVNPCNKLFRLVDYPRFGKCSLLWLKTADVIKNFCVFLMVIAKFKY